VVKKDQFNLFYDKFDKDPAYKQAIEMPNEELKPHINYHPVDKRIIIDSMKEHMCRKVEPSEVTFNEIAKRTKMFLFNFVFSSIIDNYILTFVDLNEVLLRYYRVILIMEEDEYIEDMLNGVNQEYDQN
jgi:hypothetical protein